MIKRLLRGDDSGSLMLDGMISMLITIMVLVFLMSFGFLLYQQWIVTSAANDTATRVAQSYAYPNTDPVMGYLNKDMVATASVFRYVGNSLAFQNERKGENFAAWSLKRSSLATPVADPQIQVSERYDSLARRHVEVTITAEYEIPLGGALQYFGMDRTITYTATGEAVCIDLLDYLNTVDTFKALTDTTFGSKALKAVNSVAKMIHKLADLSA